MSSLVAALRSAFASLKLTAAQLFALRDANSMLDERGIKEPRTRRNILLKFFNRAFPSSSLRNEQVAAMAANLAQLPTIDPSYTTKKQILSEVMNAEGVAHMAVPVITNCMCCKAKLTEVSMSPTCGETESNQINRRDCQEFLTRLRCCCLRHIQYLKSA